MIIRMWVFDDAKSLIDYLSRGVERAAAIIIGIAAFEATIKALLLFAHRGAPPEAKTKYT
jgi:hypothetical protein